MEKKDKLVNRITLIELLLILMLSLLLISIVFSIFSFFGFGAKSEPQESPQVKKINKDIIIIENGLKLYKLDNGIYPTTEQGISALIRKPTKPPIPQNWNPYLKELPLDPWGKPYQYLNPGKTKAVEVYTPSLKPQKKSADKS